MKHVRDISPERQRDEMHLRWMADREAGVSTGKIGRAWGVRSSTVRTVTNRICDDHEAETGDRITWK